MCFWESFEFLVATMVDGRYPSYVEQLELYKGLEEAEAFDFIKGRVCRRAGTMIHDAIIGFYIIIL